MHRPAACLFDLDGLLLDTEPLHARAWQEAASHFGRPLSADELLALRGRRRHDCADLVRQWIAGSGGPSLSREQLLAVRQPIAEALLPLAAPVPGAVALLRACQERGIAMAMVTSSSRAAVALKQAPHPWLEAIALRVHGDDPALVAGKPAPDPYLLAAERLGVRASSCWAFEDSLAGARSAAAAGCLVHVLIPAAADIGARLLEQLPPSCRVLDSLLSVNLP
jgi:pseudouridine-5'-monophosphatase